VAIRPTDVRFVSLILVAGLAGVGARLEGRQTASPSVEKLELAVDRIMAHRHYPGATPADAADRRLLADALLSRTDAVRAVAVRAEGRFEDKALVPDVLPFLKDASADVRAEAGNALAMMLRRATPADAAPVLDAILPRVANSADAEPWMYDTLGRLPYSKADADRVEPALVAAAERSTGVEVAERALVNLISRSVARDRTAPPASAVAPATLTFLENRARGGEPWPVRVQAWRALQLLRENKSDLLAVGAGYHCALSPDCGWQVRQIAIELTDPKEAWTAPVLDAARHDPSINVRLSVLRRLATVAPIVGCGTLLGAAGDATEASTFRLEALSLLTPRCPDNASVAARLTPIATVLTRSKTVPDWHEPARALEALAKFDATLAGPLVDAVKSYPVWQVRAAAARAASTMKDEARLLALAKDTTPNVATEALKGLAAMKSAQTTAVAIAALNAPGSDYQLLRESAEALKTRDADRAEVAPLLQALARLTAEKKDTARDPRTSILNRLKTLAAQKDTSGTPWVAATDPVLAGLLADFDPDIAKLDASVIGVVTGHDPEAHPTERAPEQPTEGELKDAPIAATITLGDGSHFEMLLLKNEAPIAVARFVKLVKAGYYTNLTLHRVEPLFVVQGGSPARMNTAAPIASCGTRLVSSTTSPARSVSRRAAAIRPTGSSSSI
jgi:hypothetical protein